MSASDKSLTNVELLEKYKHFLVSVCKKVDPSFKYIDDLYQTASLTLFTSIDKYNPEKYPNKFITFLYLELLNALRAQKQLLSGPITIPNSSKMALIKKDKDISFSNDDALLNYPNNDNKRAKELDNYRELIYRLKLEIKSSEKYSMKDKSKMITKIDKILSDDYKNIYLYKEMKEEFKQLLKNINFN